MTAAPAPAAADPGTATGAETAAPAETKTAEPAAPPEPTLFIDVNLTSQRLTVSENGSTKYTWVISSAGPGYTTPTGTFKPAWMSPLWYSRQYDWSPMPHAIFFHNGAAIHATQAIRQLGRPASHGCVRLAPSNAATLYKLVSHHGKDRTRISVHGSPRYTTVASRDTGYNSVRRRPPNPYAFYTASNTPPSYYAQAPRRRAFAGYAYAQPRRNGSRGLFN